MKHKMQVAGIALLCVLLGGCNITTILKMRSANDDLTPLWPANQTRTAIPSVYIGEKPYIDLAINGEPGFRFLIDTGASMTYLMDSPKVNALKLVEGNAFEIGGWGDEQDSQGYQTHVESLSLAQVAFSNVSMAFLPVSKTRYFLRADEATYDGVLGHDLMRHFTWTFDRQAKRITISSIPYQPTGQGHSLAFDSFFSKISIEGELNFGSGQRTTQELIIDTGSRHYVKANQAYMLNNEIKLPGRSITAADFGLSGRTVHPRVTIPALKLGPLVLTDLKTNIIGNEDDDEDEHWVVGSALLNQFVSVIDYHSEKLHLLPYKNTPFRSRYNLMGLELRKIQSGDFVVRYVFPDLAAAKTDIKVGDIISSINGQKAGQISQDGWLNLTASPGQYHICRVRQANKCVTLTSAHIAGYSRPLF